MDCGNNRAVVSWSASDGALSYKATAQSSLGAMSRCESAGLTCTLTNLTCGQSYTVQVVAEDDICSSLPSQATTFHSGKTSNTNYNIINYCIVLFMEKCLKLLLSWVSVRTCAFFLDLSKEAQFYSIFVGFRSLVVPCTPNIGTGVLDCFTNSALLDWTYSEGALNYTATAMSPSGHVSTCSSNFTNCELLELHCGQMYNLTVVASDGQCSSPPSSSLQLDSGDFHHTIQHYEVYMSVVSLLLFSTFQYT